MPEGDAVWRAARRMHAALAGRTILASDLRVPQHATASLAGQTISEFVPRGKHMLLRTGGGWTLHTHFRMDGSWSVLRPGRRLPRSVVNDVRVALHLDDRSTAVALAMPVVDLLRTTDEHTVVGHLGPDLLGAGWDAGSVGTAAANLLANGGRPVVEALLDQRTAAGMGNLWVVETLFLRGVHPATPAAEVDGPPLFALARRMMLQSLAHPGMVTTGDTRRGRTHWVYGRAGRPCLRCGTAVALRPATGASYQRETWWCPSCQPAVRRRLRPADA